MPNSIIGKSDYLIHCATDLILKIDVEWLLLLFDPPEPFELQKFPQKNQTGNDKKTDIIEKIEKETGRYYF